MGKQQQAFTSHVKMMVLTLVLPHAERWFYQREIQKLTSISYTPVRLALLDLVSFGLLKQRPDGNRQYFTVDKSFFLYEEYRNIVLKTTGLGDHLRYAVRRQPGLIRCAFVYGDFAEGTETSQTPIRCCVIGNISATALKRAVAAAEHLTRKSIPILHLSEKEWRRKGRKPADELRKALASRKIFLAGTQADL